MLNSLLESMILTYSLRAVKVNNDRFFLVYNSINFGLGVAADRRVEEQCSLYRVSPTSGVLSPFFSVALITTTRLTRPPSLRAIPHMSLKIKFATLR